MGIEKQIEEMNKEQQIEEIANIIFDTLKKTFNATFKDVAKALYLAGYHKTFTSDFASDTQKAYKEGYIKGIEEKEAEIEILKIQNKNLGIAFDRLEAENERLTERLKQVLLSIDTVKEMNAMCNIDEQRKQAVKEFAQKLKNKYGKSCSEYYPVLIEMTSDDIDELLKEYDK